MVYLTDCVRDLVRGWNDGLTNNDDAMNSGVGCHTTPLFVIVTVVTAVGNRQGKDSD